MTGRPGFDDFALGNSLRGPYRDDPVFLEMQRLARDCLNRFTHATD